MRPPRSPLGRAAEFVHHHFLGLVVLTYAGAALCPAPGLVLAGLDPGGLLPGRPALPVPKLLLAGLLFAAGLGVCPRAVLDVARRPRLLLAGLLARLLVPLGLVALTARLLAGWHNPAEVACVVAGLGLVAAMPVAGSSVAWAGRGGGCPALSVGLVVASTLLSPLTTPLALSAAATLAGVGGTAEAVGPAGATLVAFVVVPTAAGLAVRAALGAGWAGRRRDGMRAFAAAAVLLLCYVNAAGALPQVARHPDWDFLAVTAAACLGLCGGSFAAGWWVGRRLGSGAPPGVSLAYGLGMSNNGSGLVTATALALPADALLPVLAYNLIQHLAAGVVGRLAGRVGPRPA
ncbi:bile acid:sodium symporter [bacterium]|nr:bile acid:sodium symporter [bacterium]